MRRHHGSCSRTSIRRHQSSSRHFNLQCPFYLSYQMISMTSTLAMNIRLQQIRFVQIIQDLRLVSPAFHPNPLLCPQLVRPPLIGDDLSTRETSDRDNHFILSICISSTFKPCVMRTTGGMNSGGAGNEGDPRIHRY
jgi:hypothetical protein